MPRHSLVFAAALLLGVGCSSPPPPISGPRVQDPAAEGLSALQQGDWARAAERLRKALRRDPNSLRVHYALAVAASRLDLVDEAAREFRWVLANTAPELPEAQTARRWLTEAGLLQRPVAASPVAPEQITEETPGDSGLRGQVAWANGASVARVQLFLKGAPRTPLEHLQWVTRSDETGRFEFKAIPAGTYMLTNKIAGEPTWRLRVTLRPGEVTTLELGESNRAQVRDDFPGT
jgi:hypothetical protein